LLSGYARGTVDGLRCQALDLRNVDLRATELGLFQIMPLLVKILPLLFTGELWTYGCGKHCTLLLHDGLYFLVAVVFLLLLCGLPLRLRILLRHRRRLLLQTTLIELVDEVDVVGCRALIDGTVIVRMLLRCILICC
jgi:hypothetical protein